MEEGCRVSGASHSPSFIVKTDDGGTYRRNRRHLRLTQEQPPTQRPLIDVPSRQVTELSTANSAVSRPPDLPSNLPEQGASLPNDMAQLQPRRLHRRLRYKIINQGGP